MTVLASIAARWTQSRALFMAQAAFFFLLAVLTVQMKFTVFHFLHSWLTSGYKFPSGYQKHWYFYFSDLSLFVFLGLLLMSGWRLFFRESSKYVSCLFFVGLFSIISSQMPDCPLHYVRLVQVLLVLSLFCALENGLIFKDLKEALPRICQVAFAIGIFQSLIAIVQYVKQDHLGLTCLGENMMRFVFEVTSDKARWIFDRFTDYTLPQNMLMRASGTIHHPNAFGGFMTVCVLMSFYLFTLSSKKNVRLLLGVGIFLQTLALCLSFSRAAMIAWVLGSALFIIFAWHNRREKSLVVVALSSMLVCMALLFPTFQERGGVVNYNKNAKMSDQERIFFQNIAFEMIKDNPLLGVGYNNYLNRMDDYSPTPIGRMQRVPVHNIYLLVAAELGIVGLTCFALLIWSILKRAVQRKWTLESANLLSIFVGLLFIGLCDFYLWGAESGRVLFFMVAGLTSLGLRHEYQPST